MYKAIAELTNGEHVETIGTFDEVVAWYNELTAADPGVSVNIKQVGD